MINEALHHLPGIGPKTIEQLHRADVRTWRDLLTRTTVGNRERLEAAILACERAVEEQDIGFLVNALETCDQWRLLGTYFDQASYFDIETSGLGVGSHITVIMCYHRERVHRFVHGENLDDFLPFLDELDLLVSFNGASFDVPQVLDAFHIPELPCPHLDLRWLCYHNELRGGLKSIEVELGIKRPPDLVGVDGEEAVWLWDDWRQDGNVEALRKLERYCAADVVALKMLSARLLQLKNPEFSFTFDPAMWSVLDRDVGQPTKPLPSEPTPAKQVFEPEPPVEPEAEEEEELDDLELRLRNHWAKMKRLKTGGG